jgi:diguanylate cyclase (GGDEF)-like protein
LIIAFADPRFEDSSMDAHTLLDALPMAVARLDPAGRITAVNAAWRSLAARHPGGAGINPVGVDYVALCAHAATAGEPGLATLTAGLRRLLAGEVREVEHEYGCPIKGLNRWFRVEVSPVPDGGALVIHSDITRHRRAVERAERRASVDPLTHALNRRGFRDQLKRRLRTTTQGAAGALLMLDLDEFKPVNDTLGHSAGDQFLVRIAGRLRGVLRADDLVGRLGGDEFVVFADGVTTSNGLVALTERVRAAIEQPLRLDTWRLDPRVSVGGLVVDPTTTSADAALGLADGHMYRDKRARRLPVLSLGERASAA